MNARILAVALSLQAATLLAQPLLRVPQLSPRAVTAETFGVTDVEVTYHRPSVNGRKIWGGLVPYDVPWRAGANEATLVSFSTPVSIEQKALAAGTYSLYMIPGQPQWTVVFNRFTGGWGTYSYDPAEDVIRVKVKPEDAPMQERMQFTFDDGKADSMTLSMRWDKLRVPIRISAETKKLTLDGMDQQLRSAMHWVPQAWREAAGYALRVDEADRALGFINQSINISADAFNLRTKARILEKKGDAAAAKDLRDRAAALSPEMAFMSGAWEQLGAKKYDEAIATLNRYLMDHPTSWRATSALAFAFASKGERAKADQLFERAMQLSPSQSERVEVQDLINDLGAEVK
jgi:hypothetical protein